MVSARLVLGDFLVTRQRRWVVAQLRRWTEPAMASRLLDVGGGTGAVTALVTEGTPALVLEPTRSKITFGSPRRRSLRFVQGSVERLPFADSTFDRAVCLAAFHHFREQAVGLREIRRVLAPRGRLVLADVDAASGNGRLSRFFENDVLGYGCTFRRGEEARDLARSAGFETVELHPLGQVYAVVATR